MLERQQDRRSVCQWTAAACACMCSVGAAVLHTVAFGLAGVMDMLYHGHKFEPTGPGLLRR